MHNHPNKKIPATGDRLRVLRLEDMHPVLWHIRHTTVPARREKVELRLMLESELSHSITNIFLKGSPMTDEKTLEKRVKKLEKQIGALQENINSIGELNNKLTCRYNALAECLAHIIARPDFLRNAPSLFATAVYDLINLAADDQEISETCAKASREEIDAFFSRIQELKKIDQPSRS